MTALTQCRPLVQVGVEPCDRRRWLPFCGVLALAIAAVMAVFGLPPVDLHRPPHRVGIMDALFDGTRAVR